MPWYERQRPELFGAALLGAKNAVDPAGVMNPGVLVPAREAR
jgi:alkyldihydroxyacetonephosphate synthase